MHTLVRWLYRSNSSVLGRAEKNQRLETTLPAAARREKSCSCVHMTILPDVGRPPYAPALLFRMQVVPPFPVAEP